MGQLVERSLPISEVRGSNPVICKTSKCCYVCPLTVIVIRYGGTNKRAGVAMLMYSVVVMLLPTYSKA